MQKPPFMAHNRRKEESWFTRWFLDSKTVTGLLVILLFLLVVFVFTKVSYIFQPVGQFLTIVGLPIILAAVFYYLLNPIVDFFEKKKVHRVVTIAVLFLILIGLIVWGLVVLIPSIQSQTFSFFGNAPKYLKTIDHKSREIIANPVFENFRPQLEKMGDNINKNVLDWLQNFSKNAVEGVGGVVGRITSVVVAVITFPFILFYLLKDGKNLMPFILGFLPKKIKKTTRSILVDINSQISSYIRGQITVAIAVALIFIIEFNIIGLEYAVTLGILAGFLNLIPYLGSFLAMVPVFVLAIVAGPAMVVKVIICFVIEQTLEGRVISPLVLGSQLQVHPITILLVLLTSGNMFGLPGVILGIPVYAAVKVIAVHAFEWYRNVSGLYQDDDSDEPEQLELPLDSGE